MNNLDALTGAIGSIIISAIIVSVPILCTCSFVFNWDVFLKVILSINVFVEIAGLSIIIYFERKED